MTVLALLLSLLVAVLGVWGLVSPMRLFGLVQAFLTPAGLYAGAAFRLVLGLALVLAAPTSRAPVLVRVLGILSLAGGLLTPLIGVDRARGLLAWWAGQGPAFMRMWAGAVLVFGLFLAYAVAPSGGRRPTSGGSER